MKINKEKLYYNDVKGILNSKNVFECIVFHLKVEGLKIHFIDIISLWTVQTELTIKLYTKIDKKYP